MNSLYGCFAISPESTMTVGEKESKRMVHELAGFIKSNQLDFSSFLVSYKTNVKEDITVEWKPPTNSEDDDKRKKWDADGKDGVRSEPSTSRTPPGTDPERRSRHALLHELFLKCKFIMDAHNSKNTLAITTSVHILTSKST